MLRSRSSLLATAALLAAAALGVHELRYLFAFGDAADGRLAAEGHAYLSWLSPLVGGLVALAAAGFVHVVARGGDPAPAAPVRLGRLWLVCAAALALTYVAQESLEGLLAGGHASGVTGILGHGGWIALVLAAGFAAPVTLLLRGRAAAVAAIARRTTAPRIARSLASKLLAPAPAAVPRLGVLAAGGAGRAPPLVAR
jgi:hypothetical protein